MSFVIDFILTSARSVCWVFEALDEQTASLVLTPCTVILGQVQFCRLVYSFAARHAELHLG